MGYHFFFGLVCLRFCFHFVCWGVRQADWQAGTKFWLLANSSRQIAMAHLLLLPHGWRKMFTKGVRAVCAYLLFFAANQSPANLPVRWVSSRFAILALVLYNDLFEARSWHVDTLGRSCVCAHKVGHAAQSLESARF